MEIYEVFTDTHHTLTHGRTLANLAKLMFDGLRCQYSIGVLYYVHNLLKHELLYHVKLNLCAIAVFFLVKASHYSLFNTYFLDMVHVRVFINTYL